jgi:hypothetical protein
VDEISRRLLQALACGAAGPAAAALAMTLSAPAAVSGSGANSTTEFGSTLAGLILATFLRGAVGVVAGLAATLAALLLTQCPRPALAWVLCVASLPVVVAVADATEASLPTTLVLAGVVPAVVRFVAGDRVAAPD